MRKKLSKILFFGFIAFLLVFSPFEVSAQGAVGLIPLSSPIITAAPSGNIGMGIYVPNSNLTLNTNSPLTLTGSGNLINVNSNSLRIGSSSNIGSISASQSSAGRLSLQPSGASFLIPQLINGSSISTYYPAITNSPLTSISKIPASTPSLTPQKLRIILPSPTPTTIHGSHQIPFETVSVALNVISFAPKGQIVIQTQEEWQQVLMKDSHGKIDTPKEIDFSASTIIGVSSGGKRTGGYSIAVTQITENENSVIVYVKEVSPGKNCLVTLALTFPYQVVKIPKTHKNIMFNIKQEIDNNCGRR